MTDEAAIRQLITRWVDAVQTNDLDAVVADHDQDVMMFDVPPPYEGVRGIDAYRGTWPVFFNWLREGATFELVELDVTVGDDVAFAWGLLRCGKPEEFEANPENKLRLTMGLVKREGRWIIAHEHHSFPMAD